MTIKLKDVFQIAKVRSKHLLELRSMSLPKLIHTKKTSSNLKTVIQRLSLRRKL